MPLAADWRTEAIVDILDVPNMWLLVEEKLLLAMKVKKKK